MFDPAEVMELIHKETLRALKDMSKASVLADRVAFSEVIANLTDSMNVYLEAGSMLEEEDIYEDGEDE